MKTNLLPAVEIVSDMQVLHRGSEQGPRITRIQVVRVGDVTDEHSFWHNANGSLYRITSRRVS